MSASAGYNNTTTYRNSPIEVTLSGIMLGINENERHLVFLVAIANSWESNKEKKAL